MRRGRNNGAKPRFRIPVPNNCKGVREPERGRRGVESADNGRIPIGRPEDAPLSDEGGERVGDGGGAHLCSSAHSLEGERSGSLCENGFDSVDGARGRSMIYGGGRAILDVQGEAIAGRE